MRLVQESVDSIRKENFEELLDELIKCQSVQIKIVGTQTYLSLPKGAQYSEGVIKQCNELSWNYN